MSKINRREYLKHMSAAALATGVSSLVSFSSDVIEAAQRSPESSPRTHRNRVISTRPTTLTKLRWKTTSTPPNRDAKVTAIFDGLMGFFYNDNKDCEVGVHKVSGKHQFEIEIYENPGCVLKYSTTPKTGAIPLPKPDKVIALGVLGKPSTVDFYEVRPDEEFNRKTGDPMDWRWLPDLDSDLFYPQNHPKNKDHFKPTIVVSHGTFYTRVRTASLFNRVDPPYQQSNKKDLYRVARYVAAGIDTADIVSIKIDQEDSIPLNDAGKTYQVIFRNLCDESNPECGFDASNTNEIRRSDFHFMRKVVQIPGSVEYGLWRHKTGYSKPDFCPTISILSNDESPCMGAGFGQTPGVP